MSQHLPPQLNTSSVLISSSGMTVFSLSVEDDPSVPTDSAFPAFLSCKGCGQLLGDMPLGAGLDLGKTSPLSIAFPSELYRDINKQR